MFNAWRNNASSALQAFIGHQFQDIYQTRNLKWLKTASDDIYIYIILVLNINIINICWAYQFLVFLVLICPTLSKNTRTWLWDDYSLWRMIPCLAGTSAAVDEKL